MYCEVYENMLVFSNAFISRKEGQISIGLREYIGKILLNYNIFAHQT